MTHPMADAARKAALDNDTTWSYETGRILREAAAELDRQDEEIAALKRSYRCYSCKQVFEEDDGHGLAAEHFGNWLKGDRPKCEDVLKGTATWGGGPHDPFYRVRKEDYDRQAERIRALETAEAEMRERAALSLTVKVPLDSEVDKAFDSNDFETRKLAMAVRMVCGKILAEKAAAIRALPLKTGA